LKTLIEIYQSEDGQIQIDVQFEQETVWLNRAQLAYLFDRDIKTIGKHIQNIYADEELEESATVAKFATVRIEGRRSITRQIAHYNLDVIISVGYRVKSKRGTQFRQWATKRLKNLLIEGYAINEQRLHQKQKEIEYLRTGIRILNRAALSQKNEENKGWLSQFTVGLSILDDYDHEQLDQKGLTNRTTVYPSLIDYREIVVQMRAQFDSAIFGVEKDESFTSSVHQIQKGFEEKDFYPSIEEKAAMLLYLIVKNHSFVDGNKRIAAACFLHFLAENDLLFIKGKGTIISNEALASLTLFVASSKAEEMQTVKNLIVSILNRMQIY